MLSNIKGIAAAAVICTLALGQAGADVLTFVPSDKDLNDLDHDYAYQWGIAANALKGKTIVKANLYIDNIRDWTIENNDMLYVRLLPSATSSGTGIKQYFDDEAVGDYFRNQGTGLVTFKDLLPYTEAQLKNKSSIDLSYDFTAAQLATLMTYVNDGNFGMGFDPDCHYFNDGIKLTITTYVAPPVVVPPPAVPEPGTLALLAVGLLGLGYVQRRKKS